MRKYMDIERLKEKYMTAFTKGEHIIITEKVDGSNASFCYDPATNTLKAFSRKRELGVGNNLNGFFDFVQTLDVDLVKAVLGTEYILFGEWLTKHTITYPDTAYRKFYVFDVLDVETGQYMPWDFTKKVAEFLGLTLVPEFYDGAFTNWDDIMSYVGRTQLDAEPCGEGIVIKSQDRLDNKYSGTPAYVKIVASEFSEVHQSKPHVVDPAKVAREQELEALAMTIITERRITKAIEKFIDNGEFPADWDEKNLGMLAKILPRAIYEDCVKEEPETVARIENFSKYCGKLTMKIARGLVK